MAEDSGDLWNVINFLVAGWGSISMWEESKTTRQSYTPEGERNSSGQKLKVVCVHNSETSVLVPYKIQNIHACA